MKTRLLVICLTLLASTTLANTYYWVGGAAGDFNNISNWSTTSGGAPNASAAPTQLDNVVFDASSGNNIIVSAANPTTCNSMNWSGALGTPTFNQNGVNTFSIHGSLTLKAGMEFKASPVFVSNSAATLTSNNTTIKGFVIIDKPGGTLTLNDSLTINPAAGALSSGTIPLSFIEGTLNANSKNIRLIGGPSYAFLSYGTKNRNLIISNSTLTCNIGSYVYNGTGNSLTATNSNIFVTINNTYDKVAFMSNSSGLVYSNIFVNDITIGYSNEYIVDLGSNTCQSVIFTSQKDGVINSTNATIGVLNFINNGIIKTGNNTIGTLNLAPGKTYTFANGFTQTITTMLNANTPACTGLMQLKSIISGIPANINFAGGASTNLNNCIVSDIQATGAITPIVVPSGFDLGGNTGFSITNPSSSNLYWVGGSGNWNDINHWSLTDGGAGGACIPTPINNVFFTPLSGTSGFVVDAITSNIYCNNMAWSGALGTPKLNQTIGDYSFTLFGSLQLQTGMEFIASPTFYGTMPATITSNNAWIKGTISITKPASSIIIMDSLKVDPFALGLGLEKKGGIYLNEGTFNTNFFSVTIIKHNGYGFLSEGTGIRNLVITNSTLRVLGGGFLYTGTNKSLSATGSHIYLLFNDYYSAQGGFETNIPSMVYNNVTLNNTSSTRSQFAADGHIFNVVKFKGAIAKGLFYCGNSTFDSLSFEGDALLGTGNNTIGTLTLAATKVYDVATYIQTITNSLIVNTTSCVGLTEIKGIAAGSSTFNFGIGATAPITNILISNMNATGSLSPSYTGVDNGGNTNFTLTTGPITSTLYWVGGNGNWNDANHWSLTSGGAPAGACVPTLLNNVVFDANSNIPTNLSFTVFADSANAYCKDMTWNNAPTATIFKQNNEANTLYIYGSLTLQNTVSFRASPVFNGATVDTLTTNGASLLGVITIDKPLGTLVLGDNLTLDPKLYYPLYTTSPTINFEAGTFNTNQKNIDLINPASFKGFISDNNNIRNLILTNSILNIKESSFKYNGNGKSLSAAGSLINIEAKAFERTFVTDGTGLSYNNVIINGGLNLTSSSDVQLQSGAHTYNKISFIGLLNKQYFSGDGTTVDTLSFDNNGGLAQFPITNNTIGTLILAPGKTYRVSDGTTQTITNILYGSGNPCNFTEIYSDAGATINQASGAVSLDYVRLRNITGTGGATFTANTHSIDQGGNTGWTFIPYSNSPIVGLGVDSTLSCSQFPYTLPVAGFYASPATSFLWNGSATGSVYTVNNTGTYEVLVTYAGGCVVRDTIKLTRLDVLPVLTANTPTNIACNGTNNGSASINVSSGTPGYNYAWSNGATTASVSGLGVGTYSVVVTDAKGCKDSITGITITQPATAIAASATATSNATCNTGGTATSTTNGGTGAYTYAWSNGATTANISNLSTGAYSVTVTDANGCSVTSNTINITGPVGALVSSASVGGNVSCNGGNNGTASVTNTGGVAGFTYAWSNGATTPSISGLTAGSYSVVVTDALGCTSTSNNITITQPSAVLAAVANVPSALPCSGISSDSAIVVVTGGTSGYSYAWSNGTTNATALNLPAGNYTVTVTDANGCIATSNQVTITASTPLLTVSTNATNISCNGASNGIINATVAGGKAGYTYAWSNGANTATINNLSAGNYTVIVTDANSCTATTTAVTITQPAALSATITPTNVQCSGQNNGKVTTLVTGGTTGYTYTWSNGASTANISNLLPGKYIVTITDANGCTIKDSTILTQPLAPLVATTTHNNITCNGANDGVASATVTGGTSAYSYVWNSGVNVVGNTPTLTGLSAGTYSLTVTDANSCFAIKTVIITEPTLLSIAVLNTTPTICTATNGSATISVSNGTPWYYGYNYTWDNGSMDSVATNLSAGKHYITILDSTGCVIKDSITINANTLALDLNIIGSTDTVLCGSNTITLVTHLNNGTSPYTYTLSNNATIVGANNLSNTISVTNDTLIATTAIDANGCVSNKDSVAIHIVQPMQINLANDTIVCQGTSITINTIVSKGKPPYSFTWNNNSTSASIQQAFMNDTKVYVNVTDACNNSVKDSIYINTMQLPTANFSYESLLPLTQGLFTFQNTSVGDSIISYNWNFGDSIVSNKENPSHEFTNATTYTTYLAVTNTWGCTDTVIKNILGQQDTIIVPNVFSPNGDGIYDYFTVLCSATNAFKMEIYNRWGLLLYATNDNVIKAWDGKTTAGIKVPDGVYYYAINLHTLTNKTIDKKGTIQVISGK
jgi:gliding motility-associated-like protein